MAVVQCSHCKAYYWKFRGCAIPEFCSLVCRDAARAPKASSGDPESVYAVVRDFRTHFAAVHRTSDITAIFENCLTCDQLSTRLLSAQRAAIGEDKALDTSGAR